MPAVAKKPCKHPGCTQLVARGKSYCGRHRRTRSREYDKQRAASSARGYGHTWRKLRTMILAEEPLCADPFGDHADARQTVVATEVDHIVPVKSGGRNIRSNLLPLCTSCHSRKTRTEGKRRLRPAMCPVTVIAGPPGAGKTTLVKELASYGDLVLDLDTLFVALSGDMPFYEKPNTLLPFVLECRDAILARLWRKSDLKRAWVITSEGRRDKLEDLRDSLGAEVQVMEISPNECMRRISQDERRKDHLEQWTGLVNKWWSDWQSSSV